jgi:hypothetical protein
MHVFRAGAAYSGIVFRPGMVVSVTVYLLMLGVFAGMPLQGKA